MKIFSKTLSVVVATVLLAAFSTAQTDELRQATGLPIQIGQNVLYGKFTITNLSKTEKKPVARVTLLEGGSQLGVSQTNDAGYYYFLTLPRGTGTLVFEINGTEVGRMVVNPSAGSRSLRQDISIDWLEFQRQSAPATVSAKDAYPRNAEATKTFEAAMKFAKEKDYPNAITQFNNVLAKDPKDFVAWTEIGTVYFKSDSLDNAEACYFKAIELKRDYFVALLNLGKLYLNRKQYDNAILVLSNAIKADPSSADAQFYIGESYLQAKKGNLAVAHLNEAIKLAPVEKAEAHLRLANLYNAAGMKDKAVTEYKAFLAKVPDYPDRVKVEQYIKDNSK